MSYFDSVHEMAKALDVPLLLRIDPDSRFVLRHGRLSQFAVQPAHAARLYHLLLDRLRSPDVSPGFEGQVLWMTGPFGSLENLPWAAGLADQIARTGLRVFLLESQPAGPLRAVAGGTSRPPGGEVAAAAVRLLGQTGQCFSTDIEGVRLLLPPVGPAESAAAAAASAVGSEGEPAWCHILADALPESLDGPYPQHAGILGVIFVAAYRDHSRHELERSMIGMRSAGHRILGLVAIGPEVAASGVRSLRAPLQRDEAPQPGIRPEAEPVPSSAYGPEPPPKPPPEPAPVKVHVPPPQPIAPPPAPPTDAKPRTLPLFSKWQKDTDRRARMRRGATLAGWMVMFLIALAIGLVALQRIGLLETLLSRTEEAPSTGSADSLALADSVGARADSLTQGVAPGRAINLRALGEGADTLVVTFGSFLYPTEADSSLALLRRRGIAGKLLPVKVTGQGLWYRIVIGPFVSFAGAESLAVWLASEGQAPDARVIKLQEVGEPVSAAPPGEAP